jgi:hypothetical protein
MCQYLERTELVDNRASPTKEWHTVLTMSSTFYCTVSIAERHAQMFFRFAVDPRYV